ncbi:MAG: YfhO family protein [Gemmatimonadota bacterium]
MVALPALLLPCGLLFHSALFGGEAFFSRDIAPFFYPMKVYLAASVRAGEFPLWNPWVVNGEPFFASLQPGVLYPPSAVLYLLPLPFAFNLLLVLHFPLAGVGMWTLLRRWGHAPAPALFGALGFMLGGYFVSIANFPNNLQTVAWLPWLMLVWDRFVSAGRRRDAVVFAGLSVVAFLGGAPQMLAIGLLLLFLHGLVGVERADMGRRRQLVAFAGVGALALGLAAVQLLPFLEYIRESVRTLDIGMEYVARRSLEPRSLLHFALPPALAAGVHGFTTRNMATAGVPWLLSIYPGSLVILFALNGALEPKSRRWLAFWGATALLGVALALGRYTPLYPALFEWVPLLRPLRYPEKFYFLTALALPVMAAHGVETWLAGGKRARRLVWIGLGLFAVYLSVAALLALDRGALSRACGSWLRDALLCGDPDGSRSLYALEALGVSGAVGAILVLAAVRARARLGARALALVATLLLAADLVLAHRAVNPMVDAAVYETPPWTSELLTERGPDRQAYRFRGSSLSAAMGSIVTVKGAWELTNMYLDFQTLGPNAGLLFGHLAQDGLEGVELASVSLLIEAALHEWTPDPVRILRATNVRYYADATQFGGSLDGLELVATSPDLPIRVYEVQDPVPRAYLVAQHEVAGSPAEALRRALQPDFPLQRRVVLEEVPPLPSGSAAGGSAEGELWGMLFRNNRVRLRARANRPMLLVLTDRFYPGWRVEVNGRPARIHRANGVFRAVVVPAGESEVAFRFAPASFRVGGWISAASLLAAIALFAGRPTGHRLRAP